MKRFLLLVVAALFPALATAFPLGLPPVENPIVSRIAPENTTFYVCWRASGVPSADSKNKTEQLLADKKMAPFWGKIRDLMYRDNPGLPEMVGPLLDVAASKNTCVYLDSEGEGGALICLGNDADSARKSLVNAMRRAEKEGGVQSEMKTIGKLKFCVLSNSKTKNETLIWGFLGKKKEFLLVSQTEKGIETLLENVKTPAPQWIADIEKEFELKKISTFSYIDTENYLSKVIEQETDETRKYSELTFKLFGFNCMRNLAAISGMTDEGVVQKAVLNMSDEWKESLPGILFEDKLTEDDLKMVPADVTFALIGKTNLNKLVAHIIKSLQETPDVLPPDAAAGLGLFGMMASQALQPLGDSWALFTLPGTSEEQINGCLVYSLKNPAMAKMMIPNLLKSFKNPAPQKEPGGMGGFGTPEDGDDGGAESGEDNGTPSPGVVPSKPGIQLPPGVTPDMIKEELKKKGIDPSQVPPGLIPGFGMNKTNLDKRSESVGALVLRGQTKPQIRGLGGALAHASVPSVQIQDVEIGGVKGWKFDTGNPTASPILAIVKETLVLAFNETSMEQYVKYDGSKSLASVEVVSREIGKYPSYIAHEDSAVMVQAVMPTLTAFVKDKSDLPPVETLQKYLTRFSGVAYARDNKIYVQSEHSFPLPDYVIEFAGTVLFGMGQQAANVDANR